MSEEQMTDNRKAEEKDQQNHYKVDEIFSGGNHGMDEDSEL